jgi:opacity protein-like surface antigen
MQKFKLKLLLVSTLMSSVVARANDNQSDANASDRYAYIGVNAGLSEPVVKSFKYKDSTTKKETMIRLKQSHIYGARVGYSFYPNMMVEIAGSYQPKYRLAYRLPHVDLQIPTPLGLASTSIPATNGTTRVSANIYMLNFIYEMQKMTSLGVKPSVMFGVGLAQISIKPTTSYWQPPLPFSLSLGNNVPFFRIKKSNENKFVWQVGVGLSRDLARNVSLDLGAKMQVIHDIKIKYEQLSIEQGGFVNATPIKKTIAVGEFTVGLTYKLPI